MKSHHNGFLYDVCLPLQPVSDCNYVLFVMIVSEIQSLDLVWYEFGSPK